MRVLLESMKKSSALNTIMMIYARHYTVVSGLSKLAVHGTVNVFGFTVHTQYLDQWRKWEMPVLPGYDSGIHNPTERA